MMNFDFKFTMKLIVGLGNPGEKYKNNRHNAGCLVVDGLRQARLGAPVRCKYFSNFEHEAKKKPPIFMNGSGQIILALLKAEGVKPQNLLVIHDDLDIKLGEYKLQFAKGPRGHNGVASIEEAVGGDFYRLRIGIENRSEDFRTAGEDYVLQDFSDEERKKIEDLSLNANFLTTVKNWLLSKE